MYVLWNACKIYDIFWKSILNTQLGVFSTKKPSFIIYNMNEGELMKVRNLYPIILCIICGGLMGKFMLEQYDQNEKSEMSFLESTTVYYVQQGVYSSKESMENSMNNISYYIYSEQDGKYYAYIGMTGKKENTDKLSNYFKGLGYDVYIKEFTIENSAFLEVLSQYDLMLQNTDDANTISAICAQVLGKYEELVLNDQN